MQRTLVGRPKLSQEMRDRLKSAYEAQKTVINTQDDRVQDFYKIVRLAAKETGYKSKNWNAMVDHLDRICPAWRGHIVRINAYKFVKGRVA
jgi:hypothetical protein